MRRGRRIDMHIVNPEYFVRTNFVCWGPRPFVRMKFFVQPLTAADSLTCFELFVSIFIFAGTPPRTKYTK